MKAPSKCPMCGEKKKWNLVDKGKFKSPVGAVAGGIAGAAINPLGAIAGSLIGNTLSKSKKSESYMCGKCGFAHTYVD